MHSQHSRRNFLRNIGMTAGASVAGTSWLMAAPRPARRSRLPQRSLSKVISFASTYGEDICLCGMSGAIQATGESVSSSVNMLVSVSDIEQLVNTLQQKKGLPFNKVYADGNNLSLRYSGRDYLIENLSPADYLDRIAAVNSNGLGSETKNAAYAHNYLTYEVNSKKLNDPHRALVGKKITLKKVIGDSAALDFEDVIIGMVESSVMNITPSPALVQEWNKTLSNRNPTDTDTDSITCTLLKNLADLVGALSQNKVEELIHSATVSASLKASFGVSGQKIVAHFGVLKSRASRSRDTAQIWQAAFIVACPQGTQNQLLQDCFLSPASGSSKSSAHARWRDAARLGS